MDFLADITNALPETILVGFGLIGLLLGAIGGDRISGLLRLLAGAIALAAASAVAFMQFTRGEAITAFASADLAPDGLYKATLFTLFAKSRDLCAGGVRAVHVGRLPQVGADGALRVSAAGDVRLASAPA